MKSALLCLLPALGCGLLQERRPQSRADRLLYYSLKPIASEEQLEELVALPHRDREEWLRRFWQELDPTPATDENERRTEHERRVKYALDHYRTQFWGKPWDDRGDAHVKFGEPDEKEVLLGPQSSEVWHYNLKPELILEFDEHSHEDYYHLFGRLRATTASAGGEGRELLQSMLVRAASAESRAVARQPRYEFGLDTSLCYYSEILQFEGGEGKTRAELRYALPLRELDFSDGWAQVGARVRVFDSGYREVLTKAGEERVRQDMIGRADLLTGTLDLFLSPGDYIVGFQLEDLKARKMGILKSRLAVRDLSQLSLSDLNLESPMALAPAKEEERNANPPLRRVFKRFEKVVLRYEIYNLARSQGGRTWYTTDYLIKAERRGVGDISSRFEGRGDVATVKSTLSLDLSASPPGDYDLVVTVKDVIAKKGASAFVTLTLVE